MTDTPERGGSRSALRIRAELKAYRAPVPVNHLVCNLVPSLSRVPALLIHPRQPNQVIEPEIITEGIQLDLHTTSLTVVYDIRDQTCVETLISPRKAEDRCQWCVQFRGLRHFHTREGTLLFNHGPLNNLLTLALVILCA